MILRMRGDGENTPVFVLRAQAPPASQRALPRVSASPSQLVLVVQAAASLLRIGCPASRNFVSLNAEDGAAFRNWYQEFSVSVGVVPAEGYVKEFTRHSSAVLRNLNELRLREILTDATLLVRGARLRAHRAVLIACSGFFYSLFSRCGPGALSVLSLPESLDPEGVSLLLDFMYSSRLPLSPRSVGGVLAAATYLQMEHVADTCRSFILCSPAERRSCACQRTPLSGNAHAGLHTTRGRCPGLPQTTGSSSFGCCGLGLDLEADPPRAARDGVKMEVDEKGQGELSMARQPAVSPLPTPDSPSRSSCHPNSPSEASGCGNQPPDNPTSTCQVCQQSFQQVSELCHHILVTHPGEDLPQFPSPAPVGGAYTCSLCQRHLTKEEVQQRLFLRCLGDGDCDDNPNQTFKCDSCCSEFRYRGNLTGNKTAHRGEKPYRCSVCGAQFNRPANLKTHSRIHSGEKPYPCETCGARFVQVAHLRAHVLIHTGEKPYPCETCGTRFRHLQTLKSHVRIHTGEKPYHCEKCDLHFRHKSQLRLHLRQKHGAITNTKIRYKVLSDPYRAPISSC
ncbi:UNVERIFIED_CONTAM: hypothetical protein FKN15_022646 [Acipenser sinensis]